MPLRLDTPYEVKSAGFMRLRVGSVMRPLRIRRAYDSEWSDSLARSVIRLFEPDGVHVKFVIALPTVLSGECRTVYCKVRNIQSVHAETFFRKHFIMFTIVGDRVDCIGIPRPV